MCGVCGFVGSGTEQVLIEMRDRLVHRGPDDEGLFFEPGIGLGHRRLSIIDLQSGRQPVCNETNDIHLVYNGEIYNFLELRQALEAAGHTFRTNTDSEVVVHAYEEWGFQSVERFRGMFAFALWDGRRKQLFLARDRLGIKPLYYTDLGNTLIFASEIKALLPHPAVSRELDSNALDLYLRLQFIPSPRTIFTHVRKLPPGHYLVWAEGRTSLRKYWQLRFEPELRKEEAWLDALEATLLETVKLHLVSDVPLGAFLSGGTDSTAVVLAMSRYLQEPVKTFAIGFEDSRFDESAYARQIAAFGETDHHEETIPPRMDLETFSRLITQLDEPMSDSSALPTYRVSRLAREKVTVVLSGDGGDETFGGYEKYFRWLRWQEKWGRLTLGTYSARVAQALARRFMLGRRTLSALPHDSIGRFAELTYGFYSRRLDDLYGTAVAPSISCDQKDDDMWQALAQEVSNEEPLSGVQHVDLLTYLPEDILMKVDKMSMLTSLEVRVPLLDHRLQELAARMPANLKWRQGVSKYILKRLLERWGVDPKLVHRKKKGFAPSLGYWFGNDWQATAHHQLKDGYSVNNGIFKLSGIDAVRSRQDTLLLWNLWVFEAWAREYLSSQ